MTRVTLRYIKRVMAPYMYSMSTSFAQDYYPACSTCPFWYCQKCSEQMATFFAIIRIPVVVETICLSKFKLRFQGWNACRGYEDTFNKSQRSTSLLHLWSLKINESKWFKSASSMKDKSNTLLTHMLHFSSSKAKFRQQFQRRPGGGLGNTMLYFALCSLHLPFISPTDFSSCWNAIQMNG